MALVAAADIGGTKTAAGLVGPDGVLVEKATAPTPGREGPDAVLGTVVRLVCRLGRAPVAVGVGSAGVIDPARGVVVSSTDVLAGWAGTDLRGRLTAEFGIPVAVDNDVHAHALGESWRGAARDVADALFVAVGTGIGASLVLGGRVRRGAHSVAGHAGHVPVAAAAGIRCTCGATGHLEAVASGPAMLAAYWETTSRTTSPADADRRARTGDEPPIAARSGPAGDQREAGRSDLGDGRGVAGCADLGDGRGVAGCADLGDGRGVAGRADGVGDRSDGLAEVDRRARDGDRTAIAVLASGAAALGSVLGGLVNTVDPESVVIGGGVARCGEHWWRPLRSAFEAELLPALRGVPVVPAALGPDGALIGAARLAWQTVP